MVLVHEYPADLCGFWPFTDYLGRRGLRAFAIDLRCFGRSACPQGDARGRVVDDIAAAVAELRHRGVTRVALVGASNDRYAPVGETRAMYRAAAKARDKRLEVLSGPFDGLHGWELFTDGASGAPTPVAAKVAAFITAHTGG